MPVHSNLEENNSTAMLAAKRLAGVTPEVNLRKCITHPPPSSSVYKVAHSGFETLVSVAPEKGLDILLSADREKLMRETQY